MSPERKQYECQRLGACYYDPNTENCHPDLNTPAKATAEQPGTGTDVDSGSRDFLTVKTTKLDTTGEPIAIAIASKLNLDYLNLIDNTL